MLGHNKLRVFFFLDDFISDFIVNKPIKERRINDVNEIVDCVVSL